MKNGPSPISNPKVIRGWIIMAVIILVASFSGYFIGIQQYERSGQTPLLSESHEESAIDESLPAPTYNEIAMRKLGPNHDWPGSLKQQAARTRSDQPLTTMTEAYRRELVELALVARSQRRQFNGAPPVVPHPVDPISAQSCAACHQAGMQLGDLRVPAMSHEYMPNCLQCHAPVTRDFNPPPGIQVASRFEGIAAPIKGQRAMPGAPPQIPHTTQMRQNCLSCHGSTGLAGMRTSHPERQNCLQCHAPSAVLDQAPMVNLGADDSLPPGFAQP